MPVTLLTFEVPHEKVEATESRVAHLPNVRVERSSLAVEALSSSRKAAGEGAGMTLRQFVVAVATAAAVAIVVKKTTRTQGGQGGSSGSKPIEGVGTQTPA